MFSIRKSTYRLLTLFTLLFPVLSLAQEPKPNSIAASHYWIPYTLDVADDFNGWVTMRAGITQTLFKLDDKGNPQKQLVKDAQFLDDRTVKLSLLGNIFFSNGKKVDALAVKLCLERTFKINPRAREYFELEELQSDGQDLVMKLKAPDYVLFNNLCEPLFAIIDIAYDESSIDQNPIGSGPYAISEYKGGSYIKLAKNPYYPKEIPVPKAELYQEADSDARILSLQSGIKNYTANINYTSLPVFQNMDQYTVLNCISTRNNVVYINFNNEFLQNINIRKAMALSIDKKSIVKAIGGLPSATLIPPVFDYGKNQTESYAYDINKAKAILDANNIKDSNNNGIRELNGKDIELDYYIQSDHGSFDSRIIAMVLAASFKELGIKVNIALSENLMAQAASQNFDLLSANDSTAPVGDLTSFLAMHYLKNGKANYGRYFNDKAENKIMQLMQTADKAERNALTAEVADILAEDIAAFYINFTSGNVILGGGLKKSSLSPFDFYFIDESLFFKQ